ncbi:uncharacterized protein LOC112571509 [Pomacea canaliculata]|uniref:uncharacterized protein LOC112571509 n=1 Tax=Pomacea canaliculata TaxID=400727 RepID=UPI000D73173D|nr:uncharacterized protein LOC112571509 [Pomacea canaliculata]
MSAQWMMYLGFALLLLCQFISATCPPNNMAVYKPINETMYDRNYSPITNTDAHPLGFYQSIVIYNNRNLNPCINLTDIGASRRKFEILVETGVPKRLCVAVRSINQTNPFLDECFQTNYFKCAQSVSNSIFVEFYCDEACEESDVKFWYRLTFSPLPEVMDPDMWCDNRNSAEFPSSLLTLPQGITYAPDPTGTPPTAGGSIMQLASMWIFMFLFCTFVWCV